LVKRGSQIFSTDVKKDKSTYNSSRIT